MMPESAPFFECGGAGSMRRGCGEGWDGSGGDRFLRIYS